jgi:hypothetical protein
MRWAPDTGPERGPQEDPRPEPLTDGVCLDIAGAPAYPERFGTMTAVMLDDSTLEAIEIGLATRLDHCLERLEISDVASYWVDQLWAIDRACRALGIEIDF